MPQPPFKPTKRLRDKVMRLVADGIAERVQVDTQRFGNDGLAMSIWVDEPTLGRLEIRFADIWSAIRG